MRLNDLQMIRSLAIHGKVRRVAHGVIVGSVVIVSVRTRGNGRFAYSSRHPNAYQSGNGPGTNHSQCFGAQSLRQGLVEASSNSRAASAAVAIVLFVQREPES